MNNYLKSVQIIKIPLFANLLFLTQISLYFSIILQTESDPRSMLGQQTGFENVNFGFSRKVFRYIGQEPWSSGHEQEVDTGGWMNIFSN